MQRPPFKLAASDKRAGNLNVQGSYRILEAGAPSRAVEPGEDSERSQIAGASRTRLSQLDSHLHCSIIGTCLTTHELRRLMGRFIEVEGASDLEIHHEAVRLARQGGPASKLLHKALDQSHDATIVRFARVHGADAVLALWEEALRAGEVAAAYWALLSHRDASAGARQKAFGDVHMLSHLVGAANRADLRRMVALQQERDEILARLEKQYTQSRETLAERDRIIRCLQSELAASGGRFPVSDGRSTGAGTGGAGPELRESALIATHSTRRERAEQAAALSGAEVVRLRRESGELQTLVQTLQSELNALEQAQVATGSQTGPDHAQSLRAGFDGRKILYVGGRPTSVTAIRDLVVRNGGQFRHHDGGLEDRKGLLASAAAAVDIVAVPVDCIDHDSATNVKRLCSRLRVSFLTLRSASLASFAAAFSQVTESTSELQASERVLATVSAR